MFYVRAYRGLPSVFSREAFYTDVRARGGAAAVVPDGFFRGIPAGRFGSAPPYTYELPPVWLLVTFGVDAGAAEVNEVVSGATVAVADVSDAIDVPTSPHDLAGDLKTLVVYTLLAGVAVGILSGSIQGAFRGRH